MCIEITDEQKREIVGRISAAEDRIGCSLYSYCYMEMYDDETDEDCVYDLYVQTGAQWCEVGMSKICLSFSEYPNIVVKIPLRGCIVYNGCCDDEYDEGTTFDYENAKLENGNTWDYCESEEFFYKMAVKYGVDDMFAETMCIGNTRSGYPVYVSERVDYHPSRMTNKKRDELFTSIKTNNIDTTFLGRYLIADMMVGRPLSLVMDTIRFMRTFNIDGDMHSGNYHFDEDGRLVFIDYSDFNDHTEAF